MGFWDTTFGQILMNLPVGVSMGYGRAPPPQPFALRQLFEPQEEKRARSELYATLAEAGMLPPGLSDTLAKMGAGGDKFLPLLASLAKVQKQQPLKSLLDWEELVGHPAGSATPLFPVLTEGFVAAGPRGAETGAPAEEVRPAVGPRLQRPSEPAVKRQQAIASLGEAMIPMPETAITLGEIKRQTAERAAARGEQKAGKLETLKGRLAEGLARIGAPPQMTAGLLAAETADEATRQFLAAAGTGKIPMTIGEQTVYLSPEAFFREQQRRLSEGGAQARLGIAEQRLGLAKETAEAEQQRREREREDYLPPKVRQLNAEIGGLDREIDSLRRLYLTPTEAEPYTLPYERERWRKQIERGGIMYKDSPKRQRTIAEVRAAITGLSPQQQIMALNALLTDMAWNRVEGINPEEIFALSDELKRKALKAPSARKP